MKEFQSMTTKTNPALFISYNREDEEIIKPLVEMLRITGAPVFQDTDSIPKGKPWKTTIVNAIAECTAMLVFWCRHAEKSQEVEKEYRQAIEQGKDVIPVILDWTSMPETLAQYQRIDMRGMVLFHGTVDIRLYRYVYSKVFGSQEISRKFVDHGEVERFVISQIYDELAPSYLRAQLCRRLMTD